MERLIALLFSGSSTVPAVPELVTSDVACEVGEAKLEVDHLIRVRSVAGCSDRSPSGLEEGEFCVEIPYEVDRDLRGALVWAACMPEQQWVRFQVVVW